MPMASASAAPPSQHVPVLWAPVLDGLAVKPAGTYLDGTFGRGGHARGVQHADLNAHNLLVGASNDIYVLDFDRGRIRARGTWERAVLARLRRSLLKVTHDLPAERFTEAHWQALRAGAGTG